MLAGASRGSKYAVFLLKLYVDLDCTGVSVCRMMSCYETLEVSQPSSFVTRVQMNRPNKSNAMNPAFWTYVMVHGGLVTLARRGCGTLCWYC